MFRSRRRLRRWDRLENLYGIHSVADTLGARGPWRSAGWRPPRRRGPSFLLILLAGLAGFALVQLMTAADRPRRSTLEKVVIGVLLLAAAAFVMRLRRSGRRYTW
jgi:hypothetical protein